MKLIWIFSYHSIVGNRWLITFLLFSSHHPCVKWDRNSRNSVTVLKHFDKLREKLLANNEAAIFCIVFFISTQGIIRIRWWFWLAIINSLFFTKTRNLPIDQRVIGAWSAVDTDDDLVWDMQFQCEIYNWWIFSIDVLYLINHQ